MDTLARYKRQLTREDILPPTEYAAMRSEQRQRITEIKRRRRVEVGPFATFYFENYETMRHQVQEMLHIERGGDAQIEDELAAYNPLVPQGNELVATVMFEIDDPARRASVLASLGGIEHRVFLDTRRRADPGRARSDTRKHQPRGQGLIRPVPQVSVHRRPDRSLQNSWRSADRRFRSSELRAYGGTAGARTRCFGRRFRLRLTTE